MALFTDRFWLPFLKLFRPQSTTRLEPSNVWNAVGRRSSQHTGAHRCKKICLPVRLADITAYNTRRGAEIRVTALFLVTVNCVPFLILCVNLVSRTYFVRTRIAAEIFLTRTYKIIKVQVPINTYKIRPEVVLQHRCFPSRFLDPELAVYSCSLLEVRKIKHFKKHRKIVRKK